MGKKRKSGPRSSGNDTAAEVQAEPSRKRIRTYEDVADSEDEFHLNQDRILLDESEITKRRRRQEERDAFLQPSDEEVLDDPEDLDESELDEVDSNDELVEQSGSSDGGSGTEDEEDEEEAWGTSKADLYGADAIETEEQALEEEAEALRLQKKHLQSMSAADYGFDEADWQAEPTTTSKGVVKETLPELKVDESLSAAQRQKLLHTRYPEFEPLRKELLSLQSSLDQYGRQLSSATARASQPNLRTKHQALSAYLGSLAMYFALLTGGSLTEDDMAVMPAAQLRDHDVMTLLVECRGLWHTAQLLPQDTSMSTIAKHSATAMTRNEKRAQAKAEKHAAQPSRKQRHAEALDAAKADRIAERLKQTEAGFADLDALLVSNTTKRPAKRAGVVFDAEEESSLTAAQAEEKARKKKSLRFYTSQIAQKANKRSNAGRTAGGDDDVPHRERLRDRQMRLNAEAEGRGKRSNLGDDLGGASDDDDAEQSRKLREQVDEDDYYDMVAAKSSKKKADKAALVEAQRQADAQGGRVVEEETVGADGKRKITYAIEKNKGLTPHRHKDVRNPRVKKRKKYEQKNKKLASMKPVYKGGEGRGGYGGELTGIKSNLVRSVKL